MPGSWKPSPRPRSAWLGLLSLFALAAPAAAAPTITVHGQLQAPAAGLATGPDGALWHTSSSAVGSTSALTGMTSEQALEGGGGPIIPGPDGTLWFTAGKKVKRVTTAGVVTTVTAVEDGRAVGLTAGPDGNVWVAIDDPSGRGAVARVTPAGAITQFDSGLTDDPADIAPGFDGALWFTEPDVDRIGRITTAGAITEFVAPDRPGAIVAATDQAMWFTARKVIGRIDSSGTVQSYDDGQPNGFEPGDIVLGADGALWFTAKRALGSITTAGQLTTYEAPGDMEPGAITVGPDLAFWFTDSKHATLGRIGEPPAPPDLVQQLIAGLLTPAVTAPPVTQDAAGRATLSPPKVGKTVVAEVVRGTVTVRLPTGRRVSLKDARTLPVGTVFDTRKGRIRISAAAAKGRRATTSGAAATTQTGTFWGGKFELRQTPGHSRVRVLLRGRLDCPGRALIAKKRKKKRRVWADVLGGLFSTLGLDSITTVRGTRWLTIDRCDGTLTRVKRGTVSVRSRATGRQFIVTAGHHKLVRHGR